MDLYSFDFKPTRCGVRMPSWSMTAGQKSYRGRGRPALAALLMAVSLSHAAAGDVGVKAVSEKSVPVKRAVLVQAPRGILAFDDCEAVTKLPKDIPWLAVVGSSNLQAAPLQKTYPNDSAEVRTSLVRVAYPGKVGLLLASYDPTLWNVQVAKGTAVMAVAVTGYHRQNATGLSPGIPVTSTSYTGGCQSRYASDAKNIEAYLQQVLGVRPLSVTATTGLVTVGGNPGPFKQEPAESDEVLFGVPDMFPPGPAGLEKAVDKGYLRRATDTEMASFVTRFGPGLLQNSAKYSTFIIMKKLTIPKGLYGGNGGDSRFVAPNEKLIPDGDAGHTWVLEMTSGRCVSPACQAIH